MLSGSVSKKADSKTLMKLAPGQILVGSHGRRVWNERRTANLLR